MKGLILTSKGIEEEAKQEISKLIGVEGEIIEGGVLFSISKPEELCTLCYHGQCFERVVLVLTETVNDWKKIEQTLVKEKKQFMKYLKGTFAARIEGAEIDAEADLGQIVHDSFGLPVQLDNPDAIVFGYFTDIKVYIGIDFSGKDLQKREYKIFPHKESLRASIAAALCCIGVQEGKLIVDPYCKSGDIIIEAALMLSGKSAHFYNKDKFTWKKLGIMYEAEDTAKKPKAELVGSDNTMNSVKASQKNAKIAGVDEYTHFTRIDIDWIDTKFKKNTIDTIITRMPEMSKFKDPKEVRKQYKEFFYQAEYVMKKKGTMILIFKANNAEILPASKKEGFAFVREKIVWMGKEEMKILVLLKE